MKMMIQLKVVKLLTWFLARLAPEPKKFAQNLETSMKTLEILWQTPAVHVYLDGREQYLKETIVEAFLNNNTPKADKMTGALHEIQTFRSKLKAAHSHGKIKQDALKRESLKKSS